MEKLIKKLFILLLLIIAIDFSLGIILETILVSSPDGRYYKAYHSLLECKDDVIIFGSSRAETNYAPLVFEDSLKQSCWNTGRGGQGLPFWYAMEEGILQRYTPRIAIVNVERDFLSANLDGSYERAGFLRPFYYIQPAIKPIINKISKFEQFLMLSKIYAYNSSFYYLLRPYLIKGIDGKREDKGWKTRQGVILDKKHDLKIVETDNTLNDSTVYLFEKFIENLTNKGCKVYVVISPNYGVLVESTSTIEYLNSKNNIYLINQSNNTFFSSNPNFYKDPNHMNVNGAIEFSKKIVNEIKHERTIE
jgi:hypothetical protein